MPSPYVKKYPDGRNQEVTCLQCGKPFSTFDRTIKRGAGKYCSRACKHAAQRISATRACEECGAMVTVRPCDQRKGFRFCSWECRKRGMQGPGNPAWKNDPDYRGPDWNDLRQTVLARDECCTKCGRKTGLVVHHMVPWDKTHDNSLANLTTLCRGCHRRHHINLRATDHPADSSPQARADAQCNGNS